jgi:hypothetical protein
MGGEPYVSLSLVDPSETTPVVEALMTGAWDDKTIQRLSRETPALGALLMAVAANKTLGSGREPSSMEQSAVLLGAERLKHATLWFLVVDTLKDAGHRSDAITYAGHAMALAEKWGIAAHKAVSIGLGARFGAMLLRSEKPVSRVILRILDTAPVGHRDEFEQFVFQTTAEQRVHQLCLDQGVPGDLIDCLAPAPMSQESRFVAEVLEAALADTAATRAAARYQIAEIAGMLRMRTRPFEAPTPSSPEELLAAFGEVLRELSVRDDDIVALEEELVDTREALQRAMDGTDGDLLPPPETYRRVNLEVARATRYKRNLSIVAVKVMQTPGPLTAHERLAEVALMIQERMRSTDMLGQIDGEKLLIILPETPLQGARIFAERTEHFIRNNPIDYQGAAVPVRAQLYSTDLSQETKPDPKTFMFAAIQGAEEMEPERKTDHNTHGLRMWRSHGRR